MGQFRNMPRFCSEDRLDWSAEAEQGRWVVMTGCQLAVDSHKEGGRYSFITKKGNEMNASYENI